MLPRRTDRDLCRGVPVPMGYSSPALPDVPSGSAQSLTARGEEGDRSLLQLKSQGFRIVLILTTLAAMALVLQAGHRWC